MAGRSSRPRHRSGNVTMKARPEGQVRGTGREGVSAAGRALRIPGPGSEVVSAARGREDEAGAAGLSTLAEGTVRCRKGTGVSEVGKWLKQERGAKRSVAVDQKLEAAFERL